MPPFSYSFTTEISEYWVSKTFIYWSILKIGHFFQFNQNMKYVHALLTIQHHQLKVNRKLNVNFNLNMKYDRVRGKQKHLILISWHHWSPTTSPLPPLQPSPQPPVCTLLPFTFCSHCFWKFKNIRKKSGNNMHCKHIISEIWNGNGFSTESIENFAINLGSFYSTQSTNN